MESCKKISIIIPVYNESEEYLTQCMESIINQTYRNLEIIIIDDGSCNKIKKICDRFQETDSRIKVIHKENQGVSKARNVGILDATGDYIMFIDSDDWVEIDACEKLINNLDKDIDMIVFNAVIQYNSNSIKTNFCPEIYNILTKEQINDFQIQIICKKIAKYIPCDANAGGVWGKLIKREFLLNNNLLLKEELTFSEDIIFLLEILDKEGVYKYFNEHLYNHRKSKKSTVHKYSPNIKNEFIKTLNYLYQFIKNKPEIYLRAYNLSIIEYIIYSFRKDYFHPENKEKNKEKFIRLDKMLNSEPFKSGIQSSIKDTSITKKRRFLLYLLVHKKYTIISYIYTFLNYKFRKRLSK